MISIEDLTGSKAWTCTKALAVTACILFAIFCYRLGVLTYNQPLTAKHSSTELRTITDTIKSITVRDLIGEDNEIINSLNLNALSSIALITIFSFVANTWPRAIFQKLVHSEKSRIFSRYDKELVSKINRRTIKNFIKHEDFSLRRYELRYFLLWLTSLFLFTISLNLIYIYSHFKESADTTEIISIPTMIIASLVAMCYCEYIYYAKILPRYIASMRVSGESLS